MSLNQLEERPYPWISLIVLIVSGLGLLINFAGVAIWFLIGVIMLITQGGKGELSQYFQLGWGGLAICLLLLPSAVLSFAQLSRRQIQFPSLKNRLLVASLAAGAVPLLIWLGHWVSGQPAVAWIILPPIQVFVVIIPLWWFLEIGTWKLDSVFSRDGWGILSFSLVITPFLVIFLELIVFFILGIGLIVWLSGVPGLAEELTRLAQRLSMSQMDMESIRRILRPILNQGWVFVTGGVVLAGFIPLLEELFKPFAIWIFSHKKPTLSQGFGYGLLCGAAFAFWESSNNLSIVGTADWSSLAIARIGTGLLHMVSAGLVGLGLTAAWNRRRYIWMVGSFLLAVLLHGLWNILVIVDSNIGLFDFSSNILGNGIPDLSSAAGVGIIGLILILFGLLIVVNLYLRRREKRENAIPAVEAGQTSIDNHLIQ